MKITDRLVGDHKTFRKMMGDLNALADQTPGERNRPRLVRLVELFQDHLILHAWCEDVFYYPVIRQALPQAPPPLNVAYMDHLDKEHQAVDGYIAQLEVDVKSQPPAAAWPQTYALFSKGLSSHMKKEEEELFPLSEQLLGPRRLEEISLELERQRASAPKIRLHARADA